MKLPLYSMKDELNGFTCPIPLPNDEIATRYLKDQTNENPTIRNSPEHFSIWKVGEFDSETGKIQPLEMPQLKGDAKNYVKD